MGGGTGPKPTPVAPRLTPAADALLHTNVPVIAAVNGAAVGWGMELALMADIRIASQRAKFGELFVLRGLCSDVAGMGRLAQLVGRERAAEMLFTGDVIDAPTAERWGLVSRVVEHGDLLPAAMQLAGMRRVLDPDWTDFGVWVSTTLGQLFRTDDHKEGVRAFLEKREPHFNGS
jgi:enoyl-CoA hydratase/carnithine racemase